MTTDGLDLGFSGNLCVLWVSAGSAFYSQDH